MRKTGLTLLTVAALAFTGCAGSSSSSKTTYVPPTTHTVKYEAFQEVVGQVSLEPTTYYEKTKRQISVTLSTPTGIEQHDFIGSVKNKNGDNFATYTFKRGTPVTISVQNTGNRGSVTCQISVDNVLISSNSSGAQYGIASCSGIAQ